MSIFDLLRDNEVKNTSSDNMKELKKVFEVKREQWKQIVNADGFQDFVSFLQQEKRLCEEVFRGNHSHDFKNQICGKYDFVCKMIEFFEGRSAQSLPSL